MRDLSGVGATQKEGRVGEDNNGSSVDPTKSYGMVDNEGQSIDSIYKLLFHIQTL